MRNFIIHMQNQSKTMKLKGRSLRIISCLTLFLLPFQGLKAQVAEKCGTDQYHQHLLVTDPAYAQRMLAFEDYLLNLQLNPQPKSAATYRIPVVVHVLHKGEAIGVGTNVSDDVIRSSIQYLNENYRKIPGTQGFGNGVDTDIEFSLAVRDPNGACTNGITRVDMTGNSTYMNLGVRSSSTQGITDAQVKATASWDKTKYYNIYLVSEFDDNNGGAGTQGYAALASAHGTATDGAVILANSFTSGSSGTTTHELGHALNLLHTFEGDGTGNTCPTGAGDLCNDTPPHKRSQSDCNETGTNPCDNNSSNSLFVHNYLDYSSDACMNMFTANQKTRMNAACSGTRASFFAASNLALVPVAPATVDFIAAQNIICSAQTVQFMDQSSCIPNTYLSNSSWPGITFAWEFTNGGTVLTSSDQNPEINFTVAGSYDVTLTITSAQGTQTITKPDFFLFDGNVTASCTPTSQNSGQFGQTVSNVSFNSINNTTSSYVNGGYMDYTCSSNTIVEAGQVYTLSITANAGPSGAERFEVYIDYNNNGIFENPTELIHTGQVAAGSSTGLNTQTLPINVTIPTTAVTNTLLRMRVMADAATITAAKRACTGTFTMGDIEDYGVYIHDNTCTSGPTITADAVSATVCESNPATFSVTATTANTYQWQQSTDNGATWTNLTNGANFNAVTSASLSVSSPALTQNGNQFQCIITNDCGSTTSVPVTLTVTAGPTITSTTPNSLCTAGSMDLMATSSAGTLTWYSDASGTVSVGTGGTFTTPVISSTTTYYVQANDGTCATPLTAVDASIASGGTATFAALQNACSGAGSIPLTQGSPAGGVYSGPGVTGSSFNPAQAGNGTHTITYTLNAGTPCETSATQTITVGTTPNIFTTVADSICGSGSLTLQATGSANSIVWYDAPTGGNVVFTGSPFNTPNLTSTAIYYVASENGSACASNRVPVLAKVTPNASFIGFPTICASQGTFVLTQGSPSGGTYAGNGVINGSFNPQAVGPGNYQIIYTYNDGVCSSTSSTNLIVSNCASVEETDEASFVIFPNPSNGIVYIQSEKLAEFETVSLFDYTGRKIQTWNAGQDELILDLNFLADGAYTLQILGNAKQVMRQVIIQK